VAKIDNFKKYLQKPLEAASFEDPAIKLDKLFMSPAKYQTIPERKKYIKDLCSVLKSNSKTLAKILNEETGKPIAETLDEINYCIEFINNLQLHLVPDDSRALLVLSHFTEPIMTSCLCIAYSVLTHAKVMIRPSTKASSVMSKLYSILPQSEQWEMVFCDQESVDSKLIKDERFSRIYVDAYSGIFAKIKDKSIGQEIIGHVYRDQVLVIDTNSDLERFAEAFINQFFLFATRHGVRLHKIIVEDLIFNPFIEIIKNKIEVKLLSMTREDIHTSFSRNIPQYKVDKIKKFILDAVAEGAEVFFGSVTEYIDSPVLLSKIHPTMAIFSLSYWEPVIQLVPFRKGDFPSIVRSLGDDTLYIGNEYTTNWMKEKYYEAKTSNILGINNSPEHLWDTLLRVNR
jgi:acyl-CoA reductase-like NAD-dependent aldehyde dehydrogenase